MAGEKLRSITTAELQKHRSPGDLWIGIQGKVYDVTEWSKDHPGGAFPFITFAGQDVTDAFIAYHPASAWSLLNPFLLGALSDYSVSEISRDYRRLHNEFSRMGLFRSKGHGVALILFVLALLFAAALLCIFATSSPWAHLASGCLLGCFWIQAGWLSHDSCHSNIMPSKGLDSLTPLILGNCLAGVSRAWWRWNHNAHHIACNSLDYDPNLQHTPLFAVSSKTFTAFHSYIYERKVKFDAAERLLVSYQHWTFYPVMCFSRLALLGQSIVLLLTKKKNIPNWLQEVSGMAVFWIWYPLIVSCLPNWGERMMFVMACLAISGIQQVQFCLNHFASSVYLGNPAGNDWFEKQTSGTLDIVCSPWMDWFHGGLQFQAEHHLFPRLPRCNLRRISPVVQELCKKHGLSYSRASFMQANRMVLRTLRTAAMQARELANTEGKNLIWEAVNTHG